MGDVTVGIIGYGRMGRRHRSALESLGVDIVGIADVDAGASSGGGIPLFRAADRLLKERPFAVIIATPATTHRALVEQSVAAGAHVLVEKPLASTAADGRAIADIAVAADRIVAVGHLERFGPAAEAAARVIAAGGVTAIETTRSTGGPVQADPGVGVVLDLAVHDVDLVRHLTGSEYVQVGLEDLRREGHREISATLSARLEDGTAVLHHVSWGPAAARAIVLTLPDGSKHSIPGDGVSPSALERQTAAFLARCRGQAADTLATAADGSAAVAIAHAALTAAAALR